MKTNVVQLEKHDDVLSARDKIAWNDAPRILLVLPERCKIFCDMLSLQLLQRFAVSRGTQLGLVSRSPDLQALADEVGIPVFETEKDAQRRPWRRRRRIVRRLAKGPVQLSVLRQTLLAAPVQGGLSWWRIPVFITGLMAFFALLIFFLPGAEITLNPEESQQKLELVLWANPNIPGANLTGGIPAHEISTIVSAQGETPASGVHMLPDQYAKGTVTLTNLTDKEVVVPDNTVVLTLNNPPVRFRLVEPVTVPAGSINHAEVGIEALSAGPQGNVTSGTIKAMEGMIGLQLRVENNAATAGGTEKESASPTQGDYDLLFTRLSAMLQQEALEQLLEGLSDRQVLVPESLKTARMVDEKQEPELEQPSDWLRLDLKAELSAWYVDIGDVEAMAGSAMDAALEPGFAGIPGTLKLTPLSTPVLQEGQVYWEMYMVRDIRAVLTEKPVIAGIVGLTPSEAAARVQADLKLKDSPRVVLWPAWWPRMPFLPFRIQVKTP